MGVLYKGDVGHLVTKLVKEDKVSLLASLVDNTSLVEGINAKEDLYSKCCDAAKYGMNVCTWPFLVKDARDFLSELKPGNKLNIYVVNDFPEGKSNWTYKLEDAFKSFNSGANGVDTVHNVGLIRKVNFNLPKDVFWNSSKYKSYKDELEGFFSGISNYNSFHILDKEVRVIIRAPYLTKEEIILASWTIADLALRYKVKTKIKEKTGFEDKKLFVENRDRFNDIRLMRQSAYIADLNQLVGIKVAGGIKTAKDFVKALISADCVWDDDSLKDELNLKFALGTSNGKQVIEDFLKYN